MNLQIENILSNIIDRMESGVLPWRQPWTNGARPTIPTRADGKPFSGTNHLILSMQRYAKGFQSNYWLTLLQANGLGGSVRANEKGTPAILYKTSRKVDKETDEETTRKFMNSYTVFNADQIEGLPDYFYVPIQDQAFANPAEVSDFINNIPFKLIHEGDQAYYSPGLDHIVMPSADRWTVTDGNGQTSFDQAAYNSILLHELGHWSGHSSRLNRDFSKYEMNEHRAREEFVAELTSVFLGFHIGLPMEQTLFDNHAAYLARWARFLRDKPSELLTAAAKAQQACDLLIRLSETSTAQLAA